MIHFPAAALSLASGGGGGAAPIELPDLLDLFVPLTRSLNLLDPSSRLDEPEEE